MNNNFKQIFEVKAGTEVEGEIVTCFKDYAIMNNRLNLFVKAGTVTDTCNGTDFIVDGIPMDSTIAFSTKDHMIKKSIVTIDVRGLEIKLGIRTGNNTAMFYRPVVVIGVDVDNYFATTYTAEIISAIKSRIDSIMDTAMDLYYNACDMFGVDPEINFEEAMA